MTDSLENLRKLMKERITDFTSKGGTVRFGDWGVFTYKGSTFKLNDNCGCALSIFALYEANRNPKYFDTPVKYPEEWIVALHPFKDEDGGIDAFVIGFDSLTDRFDHSYSEEFFLLGKEIRSWVIENKLNFEPGDRERHV